MRSLCYILLLASSVAVLSNAQNVPLPTRIVTRNPDADPFADDNINFIEVFDPRAPDWQTRHLPTSVLRRDHDDIKPVVINNPDNPGPIPMPPRPPPSRPSPTIGPLPPFPGDDKNSTETNHNATTTTTPTPTKTPKQKNGGNKVGYSVLAIGSAMAVLVGALAF